MKPLYFCILAAISFSVNSYASDCGTTFTDPGGANGKYSANENFVRRFCADPGQKLVATFTTFETEQSGNECYDYLRIFQTGTESTLGVPLTTDSIDGRYCSSNSVPFPPFLSNGNLKSGDDGCLTFYFQSDSGNQAEGWEVSFTCEAASSTPTAVDICGTTFKDTGGDDDYQNSEDEMWILCAPDSSGTVQIDFNILGIEEDESDDCYDYLQISNNEETLLDPTGRAQTNAENPTHICSEEPVGFSVDSTHCLFVQFVSDGSSAYAGFEATVQCLGSGDNLFVFLEDGFKEIGWTDMTNDLVPFWDSNPFSRIVNVSESNGEYTIQNGEELYLRCYRTGCWFGENEFKFSFELIRRQDEHDYGFFHKGDRFIVYSNGKFLLDKEKNTAAIFKFATLE